MMDYLPTIVRAEEADLEELKRQYILPDPTATLPFLARRPALVHALQKAGRSLRRYFPGSRLSLQLLVSPDLIDEAQLLLKLSTPFDTERTLEQLDKFDRSWWKYTSYSTRNQICIDIESSPKVERG